MPRRYVFKVEEIYRRRGVAWARYYEYRNMARNMGNVGWNGENIARVLESQEHYGRPTLEIDGFLLDIPMAVRWEHERGLLSRFRLSDRDMLCPWWWTEAGWMAFVREYQNLPDPQESYYLRYEPMPLDRGRLVPMSSKPKQGTGTTASKKVQVPYFVS